MTDTIETTRENVETTSQTRTWLRVTRVAALVVFAWSIVLQVLAGQMIPPVAVIGVVFGGLAIFLVGERPRLGLTAVVLALLSLAGNLPMTIDELSHPSSAPAFLLTMVVTTAAVVLMLAGFAAFRGWSTDPVRALYYGWGGVATVGVIVALSAASGVASAQPAADDVQVTARGVEFDTSEIVVPAGETGFWLDNQDSIRHTFTIEELGYEIDAPSTSAQRADFDLEPGRYQVICAVPGHENMAIDLIVEG